MIANSQETRAKVILMDYQDFQQSHNEILLPKRKYYFIEKVEMIEKS